MRLKHIKKYETANESNKFGAQLACKRPALRLHKAPPAPRLFIIGYFDESADLRAIWESMGRQSGDS